MLGKEMEERLDHYKRLSESESPPKETTSPTEDELSEEAIQAVTIDTFFGSIEGLDLPTELREEMFVVVLRMLCDACKIKDYAIMFSSGERHNHDFGVTTDGATQVLADYAAIVLLAERFKEKYLTSSAEDVGEGEDE